MMKRLICRLRRHRPAIEVGEGLKRCKCGAVTWRGPLDAVVIPGSGLAFAYERVEEESNG